MHPFVSLLFAAVVYCTSPPESVEYFHADTFWDIEAGGQQQNLPKIFNPMSVPTDDEKDSRNSSLETIVFGQTPRRQPVMSFPQVVASSPRSPRSDWLRYPSASSDSDQNFFLRTSQICSKKAIIASAALMLTAATILGILYFGFPSSFDKLF